MSYSQAHFAAATAARSLQSCPTLCNPIDGSPPGSLVPGILQARTLEWGTISFSSAWKWKVKVKSLSRVRLQRPHGLQPTRLLHPWDFPGKSTGVGCHCLLRKLILQTNKEKFLPRIPWGQSILVDTTLYIVLYPPTASTLLTAKSLQSCPTLCNPIDGSPPGSLVPGILQARTLEWVAISFSNAWKWKLKVKSLSCVWPLATPWTAAYQAPPSMGFSRQGYWSGVPLPSPTSTLGSSFSLTKMMYWVKTMIHMVN